MQTDELTDSVEDYHLIVDRVSDGRQHGTDEGLVNLQ